MARKASALAGWSEVKQIPKTHRGEPTWASLAITEFLEGDIDQIGKEYKDLKEQRADHRKLTYYINGNEDIKSKVKIRQVGNMIIMTKLK